MIDLWFLLEKNNLCHNGLVPARILGAFCRSFATGLSNQDSRLLHIGSAHPVCSYGYQAMLGTQIQTSGYDASRKHRPGAFHAIAEAGISENKCVIFQSEIVSDAFSRDY